MPMPTTTEIIILVLALVAGWLFGLASHPGGARWRQRYADERDAHAMTRKDNDAALADAKQRNAELERDNARLAKAMPVTAATIAPTTVATPTPLAAARPSYDAPVGERRGWFDWGDRRV